MKGWNLCMADFLDTLVYDAKKTISEGYYTLQSKYQHKTHSLKKSIIELNHIPIIAEIKLASPTLGRIREKIDIEHLASKMQRGGAIGISVLTEPKHFMGSLNALITVRKTVELPLLMKDIILSRVQIDLASVIGADVVLLIKTIFDRGYCEYDIFNMIKYVHSKNMEVLLETHNESEFSSALETEADLVGINNRDLKTLKVDINTTKNILQKIDPKRKVIVSESGIKNISDISFLYKSGARAFLLGSVLMTADNVETKLKEFMMET